MHERGIFCDSHARSKKQMESMQRSRALRAWQVVDNGGDYRDAGEASGPRRPAPANERVGACVVRRPSAVGTPCAMRHAPSPLTCELRALTVDNALFTIRVSLTTSQPSSIDHGLSEPFSNTGFVSILNFLISVFRYFSDITKSYWSNTF